MHPATLLLLLAAALSTVYTHLKLIHLGASRDAAMAQLRDEMRRGAAADASQDDALHRTMLDTRERLAALASKHDALHTSATQQVDAKLGAVTLARDTATAEVRTVVIGLQERVAALERIVLDSDARLLSLNDTIRHSIGLVEELLEQIDEENGEVEANVRTSDADDLDRDGGGADSMPGLGEEREAKAAAGRPSEDGGEASAAGANRGGPGESAELDEISVKASLAKAATDTAASRGKTSEAELPLNVVSDEGAPKAQNARGGPGEVAEVDEVVAKASRKEAAAETAEARARALEIEPPLEAVSERGFLKPSLLNAGDAAEEDAKAVQAEAAKEVAAHAEAHGDTAFGRAVPDIATVETSE